MKLKSNYIKKEYLLGLFLIIFSISYNVSYGCVVYTQTFEEKLNIQSNSKDTCDFLVNFEMFIVNPDSFINRSFYMQDDCVLKLMDTLTVMYLATGKLKYISTLEYLCSSSDGYIRQYYWVISRRLFEENFQLYTNYLYNNKENGICLIGYIEIGLKKLFYRNNSRYPDSQELFQFIHKKVALNNLSDDELIFLLGNVNLNKDESNAVINHKMDCEIIRNFENTKKLIRSNAKELLINENDECILALIDTLLILCLENIGYVEYVLFNELCIVSNEFYEELLKSVVYQLFRKDFSDLIDYIYNNDNNVIRTFLIDEINIKLSMTTEKKEKRKEIIEYIENHLNSPSITDENKSFVQKYIINEIN